MLPPRPTGVGAGATAAVDAGAPKPPKVGAADAAAVVAAPNPPNAGADVEEGVQTDDVVAEVVDDDRVSFHLEVALNIVLDGLGEGGRCNIRPRRERG